MKALLPVLVFASNLSLADDSFSFQLPECPSRLERRSSEADVVMVRPGCPLAARSLAKLLDEGSRWMFEGGAMSVRSIYLGRLMDYPEWSAALARAAAGSRRWNARAGRPRVRTETSNAVATDLLNGPAFPEMLRAIFARRDLVPCIDSVEKVLVFPAREILPALPPGVSPGAKLPVDAQVWLNLRPASGGCGSRRLAH